MDNELFHRVINGKLNGNYLYSIIHETDIYKTDYVRLNAYYTHDNESLNELYGET